MKGRHDTIRKPGDPCYSAEWSGVSYAPHSNIPCPYCGTMTHKEAGSLYCPRCDNYVPKEAQ